MLGEAPGIARPEAAAAGGVRSVDVARIRPNPSQPRQIFEDEALNELAASIAAATAAGALRTELGLGPELELREPRLLRTLSLSA